MRTAAGVGPDGDARHRLACHPASIAALRGRIDLGSSEGHRHRGDETAVESIA
jgi:hypothetical protein